jgi:hypothetical protein
MRKFCQPYGDFGKKMIILCDRLATLVINGLSHSLQHDVQADSATSLPVTALTKNTAFNKLIKVM